MSKYLRFIKLKMKGKSILTTSFINKQPKITTIYPSNGQLSYNDTLSTIKDLQPKNRRLKDAIHRKCKQSTLEIR